MAGHTPGPWRADPLPWSVVMHDTFAIRARSESLGWLARVAPHPDDTANARLMAAAPDLLDALKVAVLRVELVNAEGDPILSAWLPDARAAIAKAEKGA